MNNYKQELNNSATIRQEIQRFEGVHPNIYAVYELLQNIPDINLQNQIRDHIINVEDSFVNSQEWTLSKSVPEIRLGIVGNLCSGKSALVHRYLTGSYVREESPEGGRFKKEIVVDNQSYLLLVRDEAGPPELQFASWLDGVIFVFNLADEASFHSIYNYYRRLAQLRNINNVPLVLVGTQDFISNDNPRTVTDDRAKKLSSDLNKCVYYETCATYGLNVDRVFQDVAHRISSSRRKMDYVSTPVVCTSSPMQRSISTSSGIYSNNGTPNHSLQGGVGDNSASMLNLLTPTPLRKSSRRKSNLFSGRKSSDSDEKKKANCDLGFGRNIPIKQGWLLKRSSKTKISNKEWKKKFVILEDNGKLSYYNSMHDYMENSHNKSLSVVRTTIKLPGRHSSVSLKSSPGSKQDDNFEFHLVSMDGVIWQFLTSGVVERDAWIAAIERQIMQSLQNNSSLNKRDSQVFNEIAGNNLCVDCGAEKPTWASLNLGCLMCIECSGVHRNLGTHISRVRSLELDDWPKECVAVMEKVGNLISNSIWEGSLSNILKPIPQSSMEERETFIRNKYERKMYLAPLPHKFAAEISSSLCYAIADGNWQLIMHLLAHTNKDQITKPVGNDLQTPLHVACSIGDLAAVQLLLWLRADACQLDCHNETPRSMAEQNCHWDCLKLLDVYLSSVATLGEQLPQSFNDDVISNDARSHVNYMYTSAI